MTKTKSKNGHKSDTADVRKIVNSVLARRTEMKYNTVALAAYTPGTAGVVSPITQGIIQGDQVNQRSGNVIYLHKLDFRLAARSATASALRVIIFMDKRNLGVLPAVSEVLDIASVVSPYDIVSTVNDRYTWLYDELIAFSDISSSNDSVVRTVHKTIRKKIAFNGTTSATASNGTNAIFVLTLSDSSTDPQSVRWDTGLHYTDM